MVQKVSSSTTSSSEASDREVPSMPPSKGKAFKAQFCRFGSTCKFKDAGKCRSSDHTTYPTLAKWKEAYKAVVGKADSSDDSA